MKNQDICQNYPNDNQTTKKSALKRRTLVKAIAASGVASVLPTTRYSILPSKDRTSVNIGIIGTGGRGAGLLKELLAIEHVEIPALCDLDQGKLDRAVAICRAAGKKAPET